MVALSARSVTGRYAAHHSTTDMTDPASPDPASQRHALTAFP